MLLFVARRPRLLDWVIGTRSAEGKGLAAIGSTVVFICTLYEAAVWLLIQKESSEQHDISWNGIFVFTNDCSAAST